MNIVATGHTDDGEQDADQLIGEYLGQLESEASRLSWNTRMELLDDVRSHIEVALAEADGAAAATTSDDTSGSAASGPTTSTSATPSGESRASRVRQILAALGEPREIVAAAADDEPAPPPSGFVPPPSFGTGYGSPSSPYLLTDPGPPYALGLHEIAAIVLLLFGAFVFGLGWFVGVALLWTSSRWKLRERLIGTLVWPWGLGGLFILLGTGTKTQSCATSMTDSVQHCTSSGWSLPGWLAVPAVILLILAPIGTAVLLTRTARSRSGRAASTRWAGRSGGGTWAAVSIVAAVALVVAVGAGLLAFSSGSPHPASPDSSSFGVDSPPPAAYSSSAAVMPSSSG